MLRALVNQSTWSVKRFPQGRYKPHSPRFVDN